MKSITWQRTDNNIRPGSRAKRLIIQHKMAVWFWLLGGILAVLALLGNGFAIFLIVSRKHLHNTVNWFLLSLAVADFFVGVTLFPPMMACEFASLCSKCISTSVRWLFLNLSMTNLCALTIDRYISIFHPLKCTAFTAKQRARVLLSAAWLLPVAFHLVPYASLSCSGNKHDMKIFLTAVLFVFKLPPFLFLVTACVRFVLIVQKHRNCVRIRLSQLSYNGPFSTQVRHFTTHTHMRTFVKALGIILALFVVAYAVDIVRVVCYIFHCSSSLPFQLVSVQFLLFITNSTMNPFVYAFLKRDFQSEFKKFFHC